MSLQFVIGLVFAIAIGVWVGNHSRTVWQIIEDIFTALLMFFDKYGWILLFIAVVVFLSFYLGAESIQDIFGVVLAILILLAGTYLFHFLDSLGHFVIGKIFLALGAVGLLWIGYLALAGNI